MQIQPPGEVVRGPCAAASPALFERPADLAISNLSLINIQYTQTLLTLNGLRTKH
jgi:hypothetical protein